MNCDRVQEIYEKVEKRVIQEVLVILNTKWKELLQEIEDNFEVKDDTL